MHPAELARASADSGRRNENHDGGSADPLIATASLEARLRAESIPFRWSGRPPAGFGGLRVDSRDVEKGDLFVAIRGTRADGHDFLASVAAAGAAGAVVDRVGGEQDAPPGLPLLVVPDTRDAAAHLAALAAGDPATRLRLVGVTGTNGKTTTTLVLGHLLAADAPAAVLGTLGLYLPDGRLSPRGRMTTPGPLPLNADLREAVEAGARWMAMEVSSHALDQHRVEALSFEAAVFTNLSREHLDYHPDMASYRAAKLRFLELLAPGARAIVNADDPAWDAAAFRDVPIVRYGLGEGSASADVRAVDVTYGPHGSRWTLVTPDGQAPVRLPLLGDFNVSNALAAAATALALGQPVGEVADRGAGAPQVPGRMERLAGPPGPLVLRDYAHTPDGMARALAALRSLTAGRLVVVFGCGGDRDRGKRPLMGAAAARGADRVILTEDNPRTEPLSRIIGDILGGIPGGAADVIEDREAAIAAAMDAAREGDVILLAGKGHESYPDVAGEKRPFDEAEIVNRLAGGAG